VPTLGRDADDARDVLLALVTEIVSWDGLSTGLHLTPDQEETWFARVKNNGRSLLGELVLVDPRSHSLAKFDRSDLVFRLLELRRTG
jgi:hypothetical protein